MSNIINEKYIEAFNHGYLLSKYNEEMISKILSYQNKGHYFEGLLDGAKAHERERILGRNKDLHNLRRNKRTDLDLER